MHDVERRLGWLLENGGQYLFRLSHGDLDTIKWTYGVVAGVLGLAWLWFEWISPRARREINSPWKWIGTFLVVAGGVYLFSQGSEESKEEAEAARTAPENPGTAPGPGAPPATKAP